MGIRVYDISKKYGVENALLIEKLHALGYKQIKQPSATIDKITAEYLIQELALKEVVHAPPPPPAPEPAPPPPPPPSPAAEPAPVPMAKTQAPVAAPAAPAAPPAPVVPVAPPVVAKAPTTPAAPVAKPAPHVHKPATHAAPAVHAKPAAPLAPPKPAAPAAPVATPKPVVATPPAPPKPSAPPAPPEPPKPGTQVFDKPAMPASLLRMTIPPDRIIQMRPPVIVKDLALKLKLKPFQVISDLMGMGVFAKQNDAVEEDIAKRLCGKRGYFFELEKRVHERAEVHKPAPVAKPPTTQEEKAEDLKHRPPVVTIMGHVDHGKTSLLDTIRKANVAAGEAGGITQHIGAYTVQIPSPHKEKAGQLEQITFLDTPGHEAFTKMRARGANVTDIAVLVVAADDGIMPQTIESINHAKAAKVPIIVAINKIDVPGANALKVKTQLQQHGLNSEDFGGDVICCEVSATKKIGIEKLLENILLQAELMELKSNPKRKANGIIIEAQLDPGAGSKATVLVRAGTLKQGDPIICGPFWGKVRAMYDDKGGKIKEALPATPARILGLNGVPEPGAELTVMPSEKEARDLAEQRAQESRATGAGEGRVATREALLEQFEAEKKKTLKIVLKADAQGSLEAIAGALSGIHSDKVSLEIIHTAVGAVSENDVLLASASQAVIIGFHVRLAPKASDIAKREGVEIKLYSIIYELIDQAKEAMAGLLEPLTREVITGHAEVRKVFEVSKGTVAGSMVTDGRIAHGARVRVLRRRAVQYEGFVSTLKRFQEDVREVRAGLDCGIRLDNFQDFQPGDIVEAFTVEKVAQKL
ncbi:MAG: translation initiation factor IF-2 [Verrucomicrobia bacterium]|nr:translation initiation factor IF-2 [Verrucomicrobiota bacterium]